MAEFVNEDVTEQILIGLNVEDLISCKSVCKSWYSLIMSPGFVSRHLNHSYKKDLHNNELAHRIIILESEFFCPYDDDNNDDRPHDNNFVGSSNGLVCISAFQSKMLVVNPLTREVRRLGLLPEFDLLPSLWGFGYDSRRDDYKVILGYQKDPNRILFHVLSLKSNIWRVIGVVKCYGIIIVEDGVSYNGALHWFVTDENMKKLIISYDLSEEEFKEIPQPDDARYDCSTSGYLGIVEGCLCIHQHSLVGIWTIWLMKKDESWELIHLDDGTKIDIVHCLKTPLKDRVVFEIEEEILNQMYYTGGPLFVESLVSPHVNKRSVEGDPGLSA